MQDNTPKYRRFALASDPATGPSPIIIQLTGPETAECDGITVTAYAPIRKLARALADKGYEEGRPLHIFRNGTLCFIPAPLAAWAAFTVERNTNGEDRVVRYSPFPKDAFAPAKED